MKEDISKNTLLVLVVLTIIISLLGTWTVISEASKVRTGEITPINDQTSTSGKVSINIYQPEQPVGATGQVTLNIEPRS